MNTAASRLPAAVARLRAAGVPDPVRDARLLIAHALELAPERLTLHMNDPLSEAMAARLEAALAARIRRQPVSQIVGRRLFWGRVFRISPDVLDPRPETELLVDAALESDFSRVLDLGTGSGAILLSLLAERTAATGLGSDISDAALAVARANASALGLTLRAQFARSDWFAQLSGRFDLIVSNPPYVTAAELAELAPEVRDWEPQAALVPQSDDGTGLAAYRAILGGVAGHLAPRGRLLVEIGAGQGAQVAALLRSAGLARVAVLRDLDGRPRVVMGMRP